MNFIGYHFGLIAVVGLLIGWWINWRRIKAQAREVDRSRLVVAQALFFIPLIGIFLVLELLLHVTDVGSVINLLSAEHHSFIFIFLAVLFLIHLSALLIWVWFYGGASLCERYPFLLNARAVDPMLLKLFLLVWIVLLTVWILWQTFLRL